MNTFFMILLGAVMLSVLGVLGFGVLGVARGHSPEQSNRLMRWRVILQGVALILFILVMATKK